MAIVMYLDDSDRPVVIPPEFRYSNKKYIFKRFLSLYWKGLAISSEYQDIHLFALELDLGTAQ